MARPTGRELRTELLGEASVAIQTRGTSFSYNQLADQLGVRAPSLHHHFPTKADLIAATTEQYIADFDAVVAGLEVDSPLGWLGAYVDVFTAPAREGRFCLCGALTADWFDAPPAAQQAIVDFFDQQRGLVEAAARNGVATGELRSGLDPVAFAETFVATLEGSLLLARTAPELDPAGPAAQLLSLAQG